MSCLERSSSELSSHDHACYFYDTIDEYLRICIPFISKGLALGEKCMYAVGDQEPDDLRRRLCDAGIDVVYQEKQGHLEIVRMSDTYFAFNMFNHLAMLAFYRGYLPCVLKEGYAGIRVVGEASDALLQTASEDEFLLYENQVNELFSAFPVASICGYNKNKFPASYLNDIRGTHPFQATPVAASTR